MNKILVITGPTATGKTSLAVEISRTIPSILISADSRQVYKGMNIVTGKDHPSDINIRLIDLVEPNDPFSVSDWLTLASREIEYAHTQSKLPIIVGGTGLYIKALFKGIDTLGIKPNPKLRTQLDSSSITELQIRLKSINPSKFNQMNNSDVNNPRRLVRAIEVELSSSSGSNYKVEGDYKFIALTPPKNYFDLIKERVLSRLENDAAIKETKDLLSLYPNSLESFTSLGYSPIISYINGNSGRGELIDSWTRSETQYFKRQLTWLNKQNYIEWFDSSSPEEILKIVKSCHSWYYVK